MIKLGTTEKLLLYLLYKKECMSTKEIVDLLAKIRKSESAVRAALFRLRKKRVIKDLQKGSEAFFSLADSGRDLAEDYTSRLKRAEEKWNGKWLLFSFNIPEKKRVLRNKLRNELIFLGFGRLHANLWVSPYNIREECNEVTKRLKVKEYTAMFATDYVGDDHKSFSYRAWNLDKLSIRYQKLIDKCKKRYLEFKSLDLTDSSQLAMEALVRYLDIKEEIIETGMKDPYLPKELLPDEWIAFNVKKVIFEYLELLHQKSSSLFNLNLISKNILIK